MKRTYIKVNGQVVEYEYFAKIQTKRPYCKCGNMLSTISVQRATEYLRLGYYCPLCKSMFMDSSKGNVFKCNIEHNRFKGEHI